MITGPQIRAGRALLDWSTRQLAEAAGVSYATVQRAERASGIPNMQSKNLTGIHDALSDSGVVFISKDETGDVGARLIAS